ncbi:hypothetical protein HJG60_009106 [Phyllostomus discolor]|uniref:Uncharacterized protein n=1 Tax=Phyllostomus discolor TaxID=89673 RepID=A0A834DFP3_9CHIR|nr:hypothetical protein HJG60_009106 [Phyllostomus discolor]
MGSTIEAIRYKCLQTQRPGSCPPAGFDLRPPKQGRAEQEPSSEECRPPGLSHCWRWPAVLSGAICAWRDRSATSLSPLPPSKSKSPRRGVAWVGRRMKTGARSRSLEAEVMGVTVSHSSGFEDNPSLRVSISALPCRLRFRSQADSFHQAVEPCTTAVVGVSCPTPGCCRDGILGTERVWPARANARGRWPPQGSSKARRLWPACLPA